MDTTQLKHVVGEVKKGEPAIIRFFDSVNEYSAEAFISEFLWLQDCIQPSKIVVLINSEGGSVLYGMSIYSVIQSCPIEVDCVIEGIAASMGSVIWAAGNNAYMHDYSILMIHNPFPQCESNPNMDATVSAFRKQLETIYHKRFGINKSQVVEIMNGQDGVDGTYFSASEAVKAGIMPSKNIIKTSKQLCEKVKGSLDLSSNVSDIREHMTLIAAEVDENKLLQFNNPIYKQNKLESNTMDEKEKFSFGAVAAHLGFPENHPVANVTARITELIKAEQSLATVKGELDALKIQHAGKVTEVTNLSAELNEHKAELKKYQDAEAALKAEGIASMIQEAVDAGKIDASAKQTWTEMANTNLELTKATLASIPGREKISDSIAGDAQNIQSAQASVQTEEQKLQAKVIQVLGEKKEFRKF